MSLPPRLALSLQAALGERVSGARSVGGGSINEAWRVELGSGRALFVKSRVGAGAVEFEAEAAGLAWLAKVDELRVPQVLGTGDEPAWLALEWVEGGALSPQGAEQLGRALAALHRSGAAAHGSLPPGAPDGSLRIGPVELRLVGAERWPEVYAAQLLAPLIARTRDAGSLDPPQAAALERVCERIDELAGPPEAPARLHGDLWSGNLHAGADGHACLIDPAAYGGHREVDLAMLRLFGAPGLSRLTDAYDEAFPLAEGHVDRVALWQLLPLLVHALLFGGSYGSAAARAASRIAN